jgi:hypothetical protein
MVRVVDGVVLTIMLSTYIYHIILPFSFIQVYTGMRSENVPSNGFPCSTVERGFGKLQYNKSSNEGASGNAPSLPDQTDLKARAFVCLIPRLYCVLV